MTYQITLFFLMSFLSKSLIKGFNEVIYAILSTFPNRDFKWKYIKHIYCSPNSSTSFSPSSKVFLIWVIKETIIIICCIIFSLFFPIGFKGVLATCQHYSPHIFPTGFLEEYFSRWWTFLKQTYTRRSLYPEDTYWQRQALIRGSVRN